MRHTIVADTAARNADPTWSPEPELLCRLQEHPAIAVRARFARNPGRPLLPVRER